MDSFLWILHWVGIAPTWSDIPWNMNFPGTNSQTISPLFKDSSSPQTLEHYSVMDYVTFSSSPHIQWIVKMHLHSHRRRPPSRKCKTCFNIFKEILTPITQGRTLYLPWWVKNSILQSHLTNYYSFYLLVSFFLQCVFPFARWITCREALIRPDCVSCGFIVSSEDFL